MAVDWGLYSALSGKSNWEQKRKDDMQNLMILEKRNQMEQTKLQQQNQLEAGMQQYLDSMQNLDVLAEDQERINGVEKTARQKVYEGLAATNGDIRKFMTTGGISILGDYKSSVLNSEEAKFAKTNKANLAHAVDDAAKGNIFLDVPVKTPVIGKDGKPVLDANGKQKYKLTQMTFEEQYALFKAGKVKELNYAGSEKPIDIEALDFAKHAKDPNNPLVASPVTYRDVYFQSIAKGASESQARKKASAYQKYVAESGQPWHWNSDNIAKNELLLSKARGKGKGSGGGGAQTVNQVFPAIQRLPLDGSLQMDFDQKNFWEKDLGLTFDEKSNTSKVSGGRQLYGYDKATGKRFNISNALSVNLGDYTKVKIAGKDGYYIVADVAYDEDNLGEEAPFREGFMGYDKMVDDKLKNSWTDKYKASDIGITGDNADQTVITGKVYIPIGSKLENSNYKDFFNSQRGIKTSQHGLGASVTNEMDDQNVSDAIMEMDASGLFDEFSQDDKLRLIYEALYGNAPVQE